MKTPRIVLLLIALFAAAPALHATQPVASVWRSREVTIDGLSSEWTELAAFKEGVAVAAFNDERDLYLAIAVSDLQRRAQLAASGLIVWLDRAGGKKQTFGIRIPGAGLQRPDMDFGRGAPDGRRRVMPQPRVTYVELLGPGKDDKRRIELAADVGLETAAQTRQDTLLYELKIPLASSEAQPYGIGVTGNRPLGLGLQSPKLERPTRTARPGGGGGGIGGIGGMGGRTRGRGGMTGGRGRSGGMRDMMPAQRQMKDLKLWTTITLARPA